MRSVIALSLLALATVAVGTPGYNDDNSSTTTSSSQAAAASGASTSNNALIGMQGDVACSSSLCVGGLVNGSTVQYTIQSLRSTNVGWMAMGFGSQMANTPMVIMWANSDGSMALSQRQASGHVAPTVVSNPSSIATAQSSLSVLSGTNPKFVYTMPYDGTATQNIIWAFGSTNPGSSATDASIRQHLDAGSTRLALSTTLSASSKDPTNPVSTIGSGSSGDDTDSQPSTGDGSSSIPLREHEKYIIAHAILCTVGFLGLLPMGALVARFLRTFTNQWFKAHWIIQLGLAFPIITVGVALGIYAVDNHDTQQLGDTHKRWGAAIFGLYIVQLLLGAFIHKIKPRSFVVDHKRPLQNYFHAVFGLFIIALGFYQVRTGYKTEWPMMTGRGDVGKAADIVWYVWIVVIPVAYFGGLALLRRQFRQEKGVRPSMSSATVNKPLRTHSHTESI